MPEYERPPRPTIFGSKIKVPTWPLYRTDGRCECCAGPMPQRRRRLCSDNCRLRYTIWMYAPHWTKRLLAVRDGCKCANCGVESCSVIPPLRWNRRKDDQRPGVTLLPDPRPFVLDHVIPMVDGGSDTPDNWQLLCERCHKIKTAREAKARALKRKPVDSSPGLFARYLARFLSAAISASRFSTYSRIARATIQDLSRSSYCPTASSRFNRSGSIRPATCTFFTLSSDRMAGLLAAAMFIAISTFSFTALTSYINTATMSTELTRHICGVLPRAGHFEKELA